MNTIQWAKHFEKVQTKKKSSNEIVNQFTSNFWNFIFYEKIMKLILMPHHLSLPCGTFGKGYGCDFIFHNIALIFPFFYPTIQPVVHLHLDYFEN